MPISWSLDDYPHFEFIRTKDWILPGLRNYNGVLDNWFDDFLYMTKALKWGVITYTFHPFVIGRGGRMLMLEQLIRKLKDGALSFTTLEDRGRGVRQTRCIQRVFADDRARIEHTAFPD